MFVFVNIDRLTQNNNSVFTYIENASEFNYISNTVLMLLTRTLG